ncbi:MAG: serine hydrolase [Gammaproteobacteria bacterium]|nr:serine hydrolase [Gammaproteobacteria bacterium]
MKFLKISGFFLLLVAILAAFNHKKITNLVHVLNLFDEGPIVQNFSHMRKAFYFDEIPASGGKHTWPVSQNPVELPELYSWQGKNKSVSAYLDETRTTSLLVIKNGEIVYEDYRLGTGQNDHRISWSMAKSFLSAMFGVAVDEGKIKSLDDPVTAYVPELSVSAYNNVPIRDVLYMASGVEFDEDYLDFHSDINKMGRILALGGSMDKFAIKMQEVARPSGQNRQYVSIDTHVLGMVLRNATKQSNKEYLIEKLWNKLGSERDAYYLTDGNGIAFVLGGLNMTTRDYARFGELFRLQGQWQGEQIIPKEWVSESTANSAPPPVDPVNDTFGYGYQWWVPQNANGDFFAGGIYGQFIYVNPKLHTVIVKTSAHRGFRNDGNFGRDVKHETIEMFRAIANSLN